MTSNEPRSKPDFRRTVAAVRILRRLDVPRYRTNASEGDGGADGRVLLVRHGPGRGRVTPYLQFVLDGIGRAHPDSYRRLVLHETGTPTPDLAGVRGVMFWLADPLEETYPECYAEARAIADEAETRGCAVVNHPDALSNTRKGRQAELWSEAGVPTPRVVRFESRQELLSLADTLSYPVVLRGDELHAQKKLHLIPSPDALRALDPGAIAYPGVASTFVDPRPGFREAREDSLFAHYYHQRRAFVFGPTVCFHHLYFSAEPIVTTPSSTFWPYAGWRQHFRWKSRLVLRCVEEDLRYWREGDGHADLLRRAARSLGLAFCGFDYATRADGSAVLFECNPYFTLSPLPKATLARRRRIADRYRSYFRAIAAMIDALARGEAPSP